MKVTTYLCIFSAKFRRMVRRWRVLWSAIFGVDRKWAVSCRFSSVQTQKKQAKRSTSPLSTSSLPIFSVSSMIRLSDIRTAMFDTDNQLRHCGRPRSGPTARKWCRKLVLSNHQQEFHVNISSSNGFPSSYLSFPFNCWQAGYIHLFGQIKYSYHILSSDCRQHG